MQITAPKPPGPYELSAVWTITWAHSDVRLIRSAEGHEGRIFTVFFPSLLYNLCVRVQRTGNSTVFTETAEQVSAFIILLLSLSPFIPNSFILSSPKVLALSFLKPYGGSVNKQRFLWIKIICICFIWLKHVGFCTWKLKNISQKSLQMYTQVLLKNKN